jgi:hypothetical protein
MEVTYRRSPWLSASCHLRWGNVDKLQQRLGLTAAQVGTEPSLG